MFKFDLKQINNAKELAQTVPLIKLEAKKIAKTISAGEHSRRKTGQGESFWQFRNYQIGDSSKDIDWRKSAKSTQTGKASLFVKQQEWEASQSVFIWCDKSKSMDFSSSRKTTTKDLSAKTLSIALAYLFTSSGERVALIDKNKGDIVAKPGNQGVDELVKDLFFSKDSSSNLEIFNLKKNSFVVLISDFLIDEKEYIKTLSKLSSLGVKGHILQINDIEEIELSYKGNVIFSDIETNEKYHCKLVEGIRQDYKEKILEHISNIKNQAHKYGFTYSQHITINPIQKALFEVYNKVSNNLKLRG